MSRFDRWRLRRRERRLTYCENPGINVTAALLIGLDELEVERDRLRKMLFGVLDAIEKEYREQDAPVELDMLMVVAQEVRDALAVRENDKEALDA